MTLLAQWRLENGVSLASFAELMVRDPNPCSNVPPAYLFYPCEEWDAVVADESLRDRGYVRTEAWRVDSTLGMSAPVERVPTQVGGD